MNRREAIIAGAALLIPAAAVKANTNNLPVVETERDAEGNLKDVKNVDALIKLAAKDETNVYKVRVWLNPADGFRAYDDGEDAIVWGEVEMTAAQTLDHLELTFERTPASCAWKVPQWQGSFVIEYEVSDEERIAAVADALEKGEMSAREAKYELERLVPNEPKPRPDLAKLIRGATPEHALRMLRQRM